MASIHIFNYCIISSLSNHHAFHGLRHIFSGVRKADGRRATSCHTTLTESFTRINEASSGTAVFFFLPECLYSTSHYYGDHIAVCGCGLHIRLAPGSSCEDTYSTFICILAASSTTNDVFMVIVIRTRPWCSTMAVRMVLFIVWWLLRAFEPACIIGGNNHIIAIKTLLSSYEASACVALATLALRLHWQVPYRITISTSPWILLLYDITSILNVQFDWSYSN